MLTNTLYNKNRTDMDKPGVKLKDFAPGSFVFRSIFFCDHEGSF